VLVFLLTLKESTTSNQLLKKQLLRRLEEDKTKICLLKTQSTLQPVVLLQGNPDLLMRQQDH
jgi:hypothetical protein